jgi:hypothetical protein
MDEISITPYFYKLLLKEAFYLEWEPVRPSDKDTIFTAHFIAQCLNLFNKNMLFLKVEIFFTISPFF